jgi:protein phosphatase
MTQEEAEGSPARHTLTNCVGSNSFSLNETREQALIENDMLLICSDGLHDLVSHEELKAILATDHRDPGRLVTALVDRAVQNGGRDNISVILLQYHVEELAEISEPGQPALLMEGKSIQEDHHGE